MNIATLQTNLDQIAAASFTGAFNIELEECGETLEFSAGDSTATLLREGFGIGHLNSKTEAFTQTVTNIQNYMRENFTSYPRA